MARIKVCSYCGVPREFSRSDRWESSGIISSIALPDTRGLWYEAEGLNGLFINIEDLVGLPIERIIAEGKRKNSLQYLQDVLSGTRGFLARTFLHSKVYNKISDLAATFGYGHIDVLEIKRGEYVKAYGRNIYSKPMFLGDLMATFNIMEGLSAEVKVDKKGGGYVFTVVPGDDPELELSSRLDTEVMPVKPGNIDFEKCPRCGVPLYFKQCTWDFGEGTITDNMTGRNMASLGMEHIAAVFRELQAELGEDIARVIMAAQRSYVKNTFLEEELEGGHSYFVRYFALRGMGNLVQYELQDDSLHAVVENARPPLMVAGTLQGIYEAINTRESSCEYKEGEGTLSVTIEAV
jgi:hypothetical protein